MRIGLIARADSRGLGIQTKAFHDNMHPAKTMVVDCPSLKPLPIRKDWYPDAIWVHGLPTASDFCSWLQGLDVVYTAETGYSPTLWDEAEHTGVRTVLHANYEFLNRSDRPSLWAAPSKWHLEDFPQGAKFLPVPIELDKFTPNTSCSARRFLHIVGRPAIHDRNGTMDLLEALRHVTQDIEVTIRCQEAEFLQGIDGFPINRRKVKLNLEHGDTRHYWDNYRDHDVLVLPRRFGGLCLPVNEALGAGMPVIMPHIEPNHWLPNEWLIPANHKASFMAKQRVEVHQVDPMVLAAKIDQFASDPRFFWRAQEDAQTLAAALSWDSLKPLYEQTFQELICR